MNTFVCPHCNKDVEINEAFRHQIESELRKNLESKQKQDIEKLRIEIEEKTKTKLQEEITFKLKDSQNELEEAKERNKQLQEQLLEMNKLIRELKTHNERTELENQKRMQEDREKLKVEISKMEEEKSKLKLMELSKQLDDTKKALENAQRKAEQKSQQLQGEVLELDLEEQLRNCFPTDEISQVPKGIEGADLLQTVRNKHGQSAGAIAWETKRTKAWSKAWLSKLREDTRQIGATASVLVSDALPEGIDTFALIESVWVCCQKYAVPLATVLRDSILRVAIARSAAAHKDEKLEALYTYLTNDAFRHRFEAQVESILELKNDLETEQRSTIRLWKKREMQINRMRNSIAGMYGELQGIVGQSLPTIPQLEAQASISMQSQSHLLDE